ncbi:hypothetical protein A2210_01850 [Candidatus Woesebacteria bacterium RIFOXYA1_FULL_40_18]|uniref:DUF1861 family protein n=4 Tax=Candidatus Woeseibacteriota TaxID=1752722 RepID=A0A0G0SKU9_9BACT|nr:MAG: hypothetical protein UT72_C0024G0011 [Candidatus Woesebacteria bacterium GW2011_GWB1_40_101]KKR62996.1 MAG: hypothetical protein UU03_C0017G0002 [Candidatus Woesebacteria bacterium GW2011_GWA1_40_45]OGM75792.1 MAG: hypothetical protein A2210_01850 [Candidatus Woesebacteria bacterium RIFOXYA1_FULL_40_18]OGM80100.1 MAG: hypothetical protein A2361_01020 [Candidatus Woesebacteria bacterium RIFOXYB1_FULL_40_26]
MSELEQRVEQVAPTPKSYGELLIKFNKNNKQEGLLKGELLKFNIENDVFTVYNPAPVIIDGQTYLWARVEERKTEKDSVVRLFKEGKNGVWDIIGKAPVFERLQDPFYCGVIDGYHILGGNQISEVAESPDLEYRTTFYRYKNSFTELVNPNGDICDPFAVGPRKIKGIRLIQRENGPPRLGEAGRISVFYRPQGQFGGRGRIGYFETESLDTLENVLADYDQKKDPKTLVQRLFIDQGSGDEEWGGANQLFNLPDGRIGVLGHIAGFGENSPKKNYYPITFIFYPETRSVSNVQMIATAEQFPPVKVKKSDLGSICYSCGLIRLDNGYAWLYVGIGDTKAGRILIKDPFGT